MSPVLFATDVFDHGTAAVISGEHLSTAAEGLRESVGFLKKKKKIEKKCAALLIRSSSQSNTAMRMRTDSAAVATVCGAF